MGVPKIIENIVEVEVPEYEIEDRVTYVPQVVEVVKEVKKIEERPNIIYVDVPQIHYQPNYVERIKPVYVDNPIKKVEIHELINHIEGKPEFQDIWLDDGSPKPGLQVVTSI